MNERRETTSNKKVYSLKDFQPIIEEMILKQDEMATNIRKFDDENFQKLAKLNNDLKDNLEDSKSIFKVTKNDRGNWEIFDSSSNITLQLDSATNTLNFYRFSRINFKSVK